MSLLGLDVKKESGEVTETQKSIESALAEMRPMLAMHLGDVEFVKFEGGVVYVKLLGTCQGCPLSQVTLKAGIEEMLRERVPQVERVEAV